MIGLGAKPFRLAAENLNAPTRVLQDEAIVEAGGINPVIELNEPRRLAGVGFYLFAGRFLAAWLEPSHGPMPLDAKVFDKSFAPHVASPLYWTAPTPIQKGTATLQRPVVRITEIGRSSFAAGWSG